MKTWLCNIMCNFYGPLLGAARVYAYVKKQGHDISLKDFNQDAYFTLLSREYLEPTLDRIRYSTDTVVRNSFLREDLGSIILHGSDNALRQLIVRGVLSKTPWYKYLKNIGMVNKPLFGLAGSKITAGNVIYALLSEKEFVLAEIERSRKILDENFFQLGPDEFLAHFRTLLGGKAMIDMAYFPAQLDFGLGFNGNAFNPLTADILRGVEDEKFNFLIPYYRQKVLPQLSSEHPEVVGISITCIYELLPAFTLAHMVKKAAPQTHVVLGGVLATQLAHRITRNPPLWNMFDSLILGPGEVAFSELIEKLEKRGNLAEVPNIIYKQKDAITISEKTHEFDINEACTPEFVAVRPKSGLPSRLPAVVTGANASSATTPKWVPPTSTPGTRKSAYAISNWYSRISRNIKTSMTRWPSSSRMPQCIPSDWRRSPKATCVTGIKSCFPPFSAWRMSSSQRHSVANWRREGSWEDSSV